MDTNNKRIFITGGAAGLGKAIALAFARAGFHVGIGDINQQQGQQTLSELEALGGEAFYCHCDVRETAQLQQAKEALQQRWGGVDVVVNNAGVGGTVDGIDKITLADWQWVLDINLLGVVRGCQVFTQGFKQQGHGYFINIASAAGLFNPGNMSSYNTSKAGVIALSETLASELGKDRIGVTVACPAFFPTGLSESVRSEDKNVAAKVEHLMSKSSITADDVAGQILQAYRNKQFLLLPHGSARRLWLFKRLMPKRFIAFMQKQKNKKS